MPNSTPPAHEELAHASRKHKGNIHLAQRQDSISGPMMHHDAFVSLWPGLQHGHSLELRNRITVQMDPVAWLSEGLRLHMPRGS